MLDAVRNAYSKIHRKIGTVYKELKKKNQFVIHNWLD